MSYPERTVLFRRQFHIDAKYFRLAIQAEQILPENLQLSEWTTAALYDLTPILRESVAKVRQSSNNKEIGELLQFGNMDRLEEFILKLDKPIKDSEQRRLLPNQSLHAKWRSSGK